MTHVTTRLRQVAWKSHLLTLLLLVAVVATLNAWRTRDVPAVAPPFAGTLVDGTPMTLDAFRARYAAPSNTASVRWWTVAFRY